jgi:hypothetical protein
MAYSKVALSLPADLVAWLDQLAANRQQSRSSLVRDLLEAQRGHEESEQIVAEWKAIYDEINEDEIAMSNTWLANSTAPTLEPYDWTPEERDAFSASRRDLHD